MAATSSGNANNQQLTRSTELSPMTSVRVVCCAVAGMRDAEQLLNEFFDPTPLWSIVRVCEQCPPGSVRLLERVKAREDPKMDPLLKRSIFTRALDNAILKHHLEMVQWLVESYLPEGRIRNPVNTAVTTRRLDILKWLHANHNDRVLWDPWMTMQAHFGDLETIKWVHENVAPIDRDKKEHLMRHFVHNGHADNGFDSIIRWLHSLDLPFVQPDLEAAVETGNIALVEWIRDNTDVQIEENLMTAALRSGELEMAKWLNINYGISHAHGDAIVQGIKRISSLPGDTHFVHEFIDWVLGNLAITNKEALSNAIESLCGLGLFDDIKRIHEFSGGRRYTSGAMDVAGVHGWLDILEWLHDNRSEGCTQRAMDGAAELGFLDVVKWLHLNRNEGCTINAMDGAAGNGYFDTLKWLHENRSEGCTTKAMDSAAANGHFETIKWLHANRSEGCTTEAFDGAAANGLLDIVRWLDENRTEGCTFRAMDSAASSGHLEMVKWLYNNRSEGNLNTALHYAERSRCFEVASYLRRQKIALWYLNRERHDQSFLHNYSIDSRFEHIARRIGDITTLTGAESVLRLTIRFYSVEEVSWLLKRLPAFQFSSTPMKLAIQRNKLDVALALAQDGRIPCDRDCYFIPSVWQNAELFQWLVRDFSESIPELRNARQDTASSLVLQDALDELDHLTFSG